MPRSAEVIRQWTILREIEAARGTGVTIDELATKCGVTTRTIRRDLHALEESGFPIYDERSNDGGKTRWLLTGQALKSVSASLTWSELCALFFSRTVLESLSATPFRTYLESAFDKRLRDATGLPVLVADNPLTSVVLGAGKMLSDVNLLRRVALA